MLRHPEIRHRHRKSARIALYVSLALVGFIAAVLVFTSDRALPTPELDLEARQAWAQVDWPSEPGVRLLQEYVQVDTNAFDGREIDGALFLAAKLEAEGIPAHIERLGERHANLWAILEGEDPKAIVLHHHMDVEPIYRPEAWEHPPFSGHIEGPWIFGRGVFDMKSLAVAQLYAFLELKRSGKPLRRSVIFLATGSEERGSELGTQWILRNHPELWERFGVVLTEGGVVEAIDQEAGKFWGIEVGQKRFADLLICGTDRDLLKEVQRQIYQMSQDNADRFLLPEVAEILTFYAPTRGRENLRQILAQPERLEREMSQFEQLPPYLKAMLRNEAHPFPIQEIEGGFVAPIKLHLLPGFEAEEVRRSLAPDWLLFGLSWTLIVPETAGDTSPAEHPVFREMTQLVQAHYPDIPARPFYLPWTATDSRFFRLEDIPSYGFSPFFLLTPDTMTGANPNERVALPGFVTGVKMYRELLDRLTD